MKVFGIVGYKNSGKTGLMERLVTEFTARGLRVATIKHAHHAFDVDQPGKDSFRHRDAGAAQVLLTSGSRWALMSELRDAPEPTLEAHLARLDPCELVLVEGFKRAVLPKIEAHRGATGQPLLAHEDSCIVAIASDSDVRAGVPVLDLDDTVGLADLIARKLTL